MLTGREAGQRHVRGEEWGADAYGGHIRATPSAKVETRGRGEHRVELRRQVDGKLRGKLTVRSTAERAAIERAARERGKGEKEARGGVRVG